MQQIEKRVRKNIRINKLIQRNDKLLVIGDIPKLFLERIIKDPTIKMFFRKSINKDFIKKNKIKKIITDYCLDDKIHDRLESFLDNSQKKKPLNYVNVFNVILAEDMLEIAKINNLSFVREKNEINLFLDKLEEKHKGSKYSFAKW